MKAVVAAFNQEKALVGAFSVITNLRMELFAALVERWSGGMTAHKLLTTTTAAATGANPPCHHNFTIVPGPSPATEAVVTVSV